MSSPTPILSPGFDKAKGFPAEHLEHVVSYDEAEKQHPHVIGDLKQVDEAAKVMAEAGKVEYTLAEDKAVLRKIDTWILPVLCIAYLVQQLDKSSVSYAAVFDLREATHLKGQEYSWLTSIVYLAQLGFQPLSSFALVKFKMHHWLLFNMLGWSTVTAASAAAHNFAGLATCRFFLGMFEATIAPTSVAITQMYWRRREQSYRLVIWQIANSCAAIIGPLLSYGVGHAAKSGKIHAYQAIFICLGLIGVAAVPVIAFLLPEHPATAKFLRHGNDRAIALERLRDNNTGTKNSTWKWDQVRECLTEFKTWGWALMFLCCALPSGGFGAFGGIITKGFGFDAFEAVLMQMPTGAIQIVVLIFSIWLTNKIKMRFPVIAVLTLFPIAGAVGLLKVPRDQPKSLLGCYYVALILGVLQPLMYSWANLNAAGHTKKVVTMAVAFVFQCVGNIVGPQVYLAREAPKYYTGIYVDIAFWCLLAILALVMGAHLKYLNKKQEQRRVALGRPAEVKDTSIMSLEEGRAYKEELRLALLAEGKDVKDMNLESFDDLTDRQNPDFFYVI
ncbi:hypothetical protein QFC22_003509 [Naganishia vaughanmartiniae]|uniref:Uncharacterized protein n=1 Tax=Naganishia vaughanmartiniae TaxID=1424756 RepID=A0ACC2X4S5_9TREE|nr:hypothetical protein QFC22_003509 [Naganishia vaughanmartiniae]